jgi:hypothetical protein
MPPLPTGPPFEVLEDFLCKCGNWTPPNTLTEEHSRRFCGIVRKMEGRQRKRVGGGKKLEDREKGWGLGGSDRGFGSSARGLGSWERRLGARALIFR